MWGCGWEKPTSDKQLFPHHVYMQIAFWFVAQALLAESHFCILFCQNVVSWSLVWKTLHYHWCCIFIRASSFFFVLSHVYLCHSILWIAGGSVIKNLPTVQEVQERWVLSLGWEDSLEEEMATHSSILAGKIPWTEENVRLQSMGLQRVGRDWENEHAYIEVFGPTRFYMQDLFK